MMPNNYLLVRHGQSEGNLAVEASKAGDNGLYTERYVMTPGTQWRLTDVGMAQAAAMGSWLREFGPQVDRFYVSPYVRTRMTAAQLMLPVPEMGWRMNRAYREREWGEIEALPRSTFEKDYPNSARVKKVNPLYWAPPGGESIADVGENRVRNILDTLHRECEGETVLAVTHGENMWAHRLVLERWSDETFLKMDSDKTQRIANCQTLWYRQSSTGDPHLRELCVITPILENGKWVARVTQDWQEFSFPRYSNEELWDTVKDVPPIF